MGFEWEADVLVWAGLDAARDDEEGGLLGNPDVGRLGEGTLAPGMFRRFEGFGGVKAGNVPNTHKKQDFIAWSCSAFLKRLFSCNKNN